MSVFSSIKAVLVGIESSAAKFATAFEKLFKKAPSVIQAVSNFTGEAAPIIIAAVAIADPVAEPEVAAALAVAETGLAAIEASAQAANSGQSLLANLQNFAATVPALLSGLAIKNPQTQKAVEKIVALITGEAKVLLPVVEAAVKQLSASK